MQKKKRTETCLKKKKKQNECMEEIGIEKKKKQNNILIFVQYEMSEKTLKYGKIVVNKKEFHASKQPIALLSIWHTYM